MTRIGLSSRDLNGVSPIGGRRLFLATGLAFALIFFLTGNTTRAAGLESARPVDSSPAGDAQGGPPALDAAAGPATGAFGAGRSMVAGYSSAAVGKTKSKVYAVHLGWSYHPIDHVSVNLDGVGYSIEHGNSTIAGGLDLLPRWHYLVRDRWSLYVDGGPGFMYGRRALRDPGTHFNFTLQAGFGATYSVRERIIPMTGFRWFHISNARIRGKDRNVGFDSPMFYFGVMIPLQNR